jgi:hypothetical protein
MALLIFGYCIAPKDTYIRGYLIVADNIETGYVEPLNHSNR